MSLVKCISNLNVILSFRLHLKDILPLTEDHFVFGNIPENLRIGLDSNDDENWTLPSLPITMKIPRYGDNLLMEEHVLDYVDVCSSD